MAEPPQAPPSAKPEKPPLPDPARLRLLILNSLIALNQANVTGNYTVLRELGTASFRGAHTDARLAEIFAELRYRRIDLTPVLLMDPKLVRQPEVDDQALLRLTGFFETAPEQVVFDLAFVPEQGEWRLHGIAVQTRPAPAQSASQQPSGAPATAPGGGRVKTPASKP